MSAPTRLDEYRQRRAERESDRQAFAEQREHGLRLRKEAKLRHLAARAAAQLADGTSPAPADGAAAGSPVQFSAPAGGPAPNAEPAAHLVDVAPPSPPSGEVAGASVQPRAQLANGTPPASAEGAGAGSPVQFSAPAGGPAPNAEPAATRPEAHPAIAAAGGESGARPDRRHLALVARDEPAPVMPDDEETFDPGPPADAILDAPCDVETFDDCAYDTEEEYPGDQEAC